MENRRAEYSATAAKAKEACVDAKKMYNIVEAKHAASGVCRLKTPYHLTMSDKRERDRNLIQLQRVTDVDGNEVIKTFIQFLPRRLFTAKSLIN